MKCNVPHCLSSLPSSDGNFIYTLKDATDNDIREALEIMRNREGKDKARISSCERELRKRERTKQTQII